MAKFEIHQSLSHTNYHRYHPVVSTQSTQAEEIKKVKLFVTFCQRIETNILRMKESCSCYGIAPTVATASPFLHPHFNQHVRKSIY